MKNIIKNLALATVLSSVVSVSAMADSGMMKPFDQMKWTAIGETGMSLSIIWGDRDSGPYAMYLKLPGNNYAVSSHAHTNDYRGITVQGVWQHEFAGEKKQLPVGSYVFQPGNEFHTDSCVSKEECILLIQQDGKGDAIFPE
jgi:anti-sigma factor ChrR (cupin superfamily)